MVLHLEASAPSLPPSNFVTERRLGRVFASLEIIDTNPDAMLIMFARMIILDARRHYDTDLIEYMAYSPDFRPVPAMHQADTYIATFERRDGITNFIGFH